MSQLSQRLKRNFKDKEYAHAYVDSFLNTSIASQIRVLRKDRKWTQKQLAKKTEMEQSRISALEDVNYDQWTISTLKRLAAAFDVTLNVAFGKFTDKIEDIEHFSYESLKVPPRMKDLESAESTESDITASSSYLRLVVNNDLDVSSDSEAKSQIEIAQPINEAEESPQSEVA